MVLNGSSIGAWNLEIPTFIIASVDKYTTADIKNVSSSSLFYGIFLVRQCIDPNAVVEWCTYAHPYIKSISFH